MSVSFYWCLCALTDGEYNSLKPMFENANRNAAIPERYQYVFELCEKSPLSILPKYIPYDELSSEKQNIHKNGYIDGKLANEFCMAFNLLTYRDIFQKLPLNEHDVLDFIILSGTTPVSVLYYALLPHIAEKLPGFAGNMIIHKSKLDQTIHAVDDILRYLDEKAWDRARRYINGCTAGKPSKGDDDEIHKIFRALPDGLRETRRREKHFASVATHEF